MNITSRYKEDKLKARAKKRRATIQAILFIAFLSILLFMFIQNVNKISAKSFATCPEVDTWDRECGHLVVEKDITKFKKHSPEWWNAYCNSVLGTEEECK